MKRPGLSSLVIIWISALSSASAVEKSAGWEELVDLYYKIEVINYCSLANQSVIDGFHKRHRVLLQKHSLNTAQIDQIRGEAWAAGHAEWDNRGLGGFRGWCKTEGKEYFEFFTDS